MVKLLKRETTLFGHIFCIYTLIPYCLFYFQKSFDKFGQVGFDRILFGQQLLFAFVYSGLLNLI